MNNAYRKYRTALANRFKRLEARNYKTKEAYRLWSRTARQADRLTKAEKGNGRWRLNLPNKRPHSKSLAILARRKDRIDTVMNAGRSSNN